MNELVIKAFTIVLIAIEVAIGSHCLRWTHTPHGERCIVPRATPRPELVAGWHPIAFGMMTCTKGDCD